MAIRNLSHLIALLPLRSEIIHTLDQVKANPLTQTYFKKKSLSEFKRPMLGKQLEAMKGWVPNS